MPFYTYIVRCSDASYYIATPMISKRAYPTTTSTV
jgi:hypothetical protein